MARLALPLFLLLAAAVALALAAAPAHGETIELGSRRWLEDLGAVAPAMGPTAADDDLDMGYISYGALKPNTVPCSIPGGSYYNCVDGAKGAEVNPYTRSCTEIIRCRA